MQMVITYETHALFVRRLIGAQNTLFIASLPEQAAHSRTVLNEVARRRDAC